MELEESIDNLLQYIMKGNHSEKVAELLTQKEKELASVKERLEKTVDPRSHIAQPIPISWVKKRVSDLKELFDQYPEKTYLLRQEIKKGLTDKIVMRPSLCKSDQLTYIAEVNADPLSLWGTTPTVSLIGHSATGSRTPV